MRRNLQLNERILADFDAVRLTNERVWIRSAIDGGEGMVSLRLAQLDWVAVSRTARPVWLVVAMFCVLLFSGDIVQRHPSGLWVVALLGTIVAVVLYVLSRRVALRMGAGQGRIELFLRGGSIHLAAAVAFADQVEEAATLAAQRVSPVEDHRQAG